jgi:hypothetical protein
MCLAWVMENGSCTKVDELDDVAFCHDAVVKFKISVSEAHFVEVFHTVAYLAEYAIDFWTTHFASHDDREEVERSKLHDLGSGGEQWKEMRKGKNKTS